MFPGTASQLAKLGASYQWEGLCCLLRWVVKSSYLTLERLVPDRSAVRRVVLFEGGKYFSLAGNTSFKVRKEWRRSTQARLTFLEPASFVWRIMEWMSGEPLFSPRCRFNHLACTNSFPVHSTPAKRGLLRSLFLQIRNQTQGRLRGLTKVA